MQEDSVTVTLLPTQRTESKQRYGQGTRRSAERDITAAFDGVHGRCWVNQTNDDIHVTVTA